MEFQIVSEVSRSELRSVTAEICRQGLPGHNEFLAGVLSVVSGLGAKWVRSQTVRAELMDVRLPWHARRGDDIDEGIPRTGMSVSEAALHLESRTRVRSTHFYRQIMRFEADANVGQEIILTQVVPRQLPTYRDLVIDADGFTTLDGLHRLIAAAITESPEQVVTFIAALKL